MKKLFCIALILFVPHLQAQHSFMFGQEPKLQINNRILANVNGKPISVIDAMKKMDVIFFRQFPNPELDRSKGAVLSNELERHAATTHR